MHRINLALQGGGSHGAFTWGVLDRLLEEPEISFSGISGTSAGACNAVLVAEGLTEGGPDRARAQLEGFWQLVAKAGAYSPFKRTPWDQLAGHYTLDTSPAHVWFDVMSRFFSPYQLNPGGEHPLRPLLNQFINFERVRGCTATKLFVNATDVRTGTLRVFREHEMTVDMVLASTCLPSMFHAVEVEDRFYWDGGYIANPALHPMMEATQEPDLVIVQINPLDIPELPKDARSIINRVGEISFNASLIKEVRLIHQINDLICSGELTSDQYRRVFMHMIHGGEHLSRFDNSSKLLTEWGFLTRLRDLGRNAAERWLQSCGRRLGRKSTLDAQALIAGRIVWKNTEPNLGIPSCD